MSIRQVIHVRYNDLTALTEELEALFPERNFVIDCEMGQIVLTMPRELTQDELLRISSKQRHYQRQSDRRRR